LLQVAVEVSICRGPFGEGLVLKSNILKSIISFQWDSRQKLWCESVREGSDYDIFSLTSSVLQNIILPPPDPFVKSKLSYFQNEIEINSYLCKSNIRQQTLLLNLQERIVIYYTAQFALESSPNGLSTKVLCTIFYTILITYQISADLDVSQIIWLVLFMLKESEKICQLANRESISFIGDISSGSMSSEKYSTTAEELVQIGDVNLDINETSKVLPKLDLKKPGESRDNNKTDQSFINNHIQELGKTEILMAEQNISSGNESKARDESITNDNDETKSIRNGCNNTEFCNRPTESVNMKEKENFNEKTCQLNFVESINIQKVKVREAECLNIFALALLLNVIKDVQFFWDENIQDENLLSESMVNELLDLVNNSISHTDGTSGLGITPGGNLVETNILEATNPLGTNRFYQHPESKRIHELLEIISSKQAASAEAFRST
jgi:hypothetical protein